MVVAAAMVAAVVMLVEETLAVVVVSLGMILCLQRVRFSCLLKRRSGWTDGPTDLRTYGQTDLRTDRPSYRNARTHLKISGLSPF